MPCNQAFLHRTSSDEDGKCSSLRKSGVNNGRAQVLRGQSINLSLPVRERRCVFVEDDFASFEAAILGLNLGFNAAIDEDIFDIYVQSSLWQPNQG